ncbi:hypothetical protein [Methylomagnum sp.]
MLPAVLFFFAAFNLMRWIENLFLEGSGVPPGSFVNASFGALIVGKVLLIVDLFPAVNAFRNRPLIYNTLWKTFLYSLGAFLFRAGEEFVPLAVGVGSLSDGFERYLAEIRWPQFWAVQAFIGMMLFIFVASRELIDAVGAARARRLFFGW